MSTSYCLTTITYLEPDTSSCQTSNARLVTLGCCFTCFGSFRHGNSHLCFAFQYNPPLAHITFPTCNTKLYRRLSEGHNLLYYRISYSWLSSLPHSSCLLLVVARKISLSKYYEVQIHQRSSASFLAS
jgi:hypothetical protein